MKKYKLLIIILLLILLPINIFASEQLENGWHSVPNVSSSCNKKTNWAYYKNGEEKKRFCRILIIHRGWGDAPDNSLAAFQRVVDNGYNAFEVDVRFTKDSVPVLIHDSTIDRTARDSSNNEVTGGIKVKSLYYSELLTYNFPISREGTYLSNYKNNKITKFEDAVSFSKNNGLLMIIELKTGSENQIKSLVNIVRNYNMDNHVMWLSYYPILLSYINKYDDDETLYVLKMTENCTEDKFFCGSSEEITKIHNQLDTGKNIVVLAGEKNVDDRGYAYTSTINMPDSTSPYTNTTYQIPTISKGTITLSNNNVSLNKGASKTINYTYNGDGTVKCKSNNESIVSCTINKSNNTVTVKNLANSNSNVNVMVYATQGTNYSATDDTILNVTTIEAIVNVESIALSNTTLSMNVNESKTINVIYTPSNASNKNITWTSSNMSVATVSNGTVIAIVPGTTTITAKSVDGNKTASCNVTVTAPVTGVSLNKASTSIIVGASETLVATITPSNASNKNVTWLSSNTSVATVFNGKINAIAPGSTTITVKTLNGNKTASCNVTVTAPVTGVSLNKTSTSLVVGGSETLISIITPNNATNKNVVWSSSNSNIASVSNGTITANSAGSATITVKTVDGNKTASCNVNVSNKVINVTGVKLSNSEISLITNEAKTITANIEPTNATNQNIIWSSSNENVAVVENGIITGLSAGSAIISAKSVDGNKASSCKVTVTDPVIIININKISTTLAVGGSETLVAVIKSNIKTNQDVVWSSSDENIVTVENGILTAKAAGSATITVKTMDGKVTANCIVTVSSKEEPVTGVTLSNNEITLDTGEIKTITANIEPLNATNQNVIWTSSDKNIVVVENGILTGISPGTATITVKTMDGDKTADCIVTVNQSKEEIPDDISNETKNNNYIYLTIISSIIIVSIIGIVLKNKHKKTP